MSDDMDEAYGDWQQQQEWEACQDALPPHKREGYAERIYEMADMERKRLREEGK